MSITHLASFQTHPCQEGWRIPSMLILPLFKIILGVMINSLILLYLINVIKHTLNIKLTAFSSFRKTSPDSWMLRSIENSKNIFPKLSYILVLSENIKEIKAKKNKWKIFDGTKSWDFNYYLPWLSTNFHITDESSFHFISSFFA